MDTVKREFGWPFMMCREYGIKDSKSQVVHVLLWDRLEVGFNVVVWILLYTVLLGLQRFVGSRLASNESDIDPRRDHSNTIQNMRHALLAIVEMPDDDNTIERMREVARDALKPLPCSGPPDRDTDTGPKG